jgi:catechol 2,3-dioxygenase-like lactoylglutathione lyase family enzyme
MSNTLANGLPGLRGSDHIGFTVPDMDEAVDFFVNVLGCDEIFTIGPFRDDEGDFMSKQLNVDPRAVIPQIRMFRCENGTNIELFEFEAPGRRDEPPRNSDVGGHHLALYVDDIDEAIEYLRSKNIRVLGETMHMQDGANAGLSWVYFLAPWGMQLELVSYQKGLAYEKDTEWRLWKP